MWIYYVLLVLFYISRVNPVNFKEKQGDAANSYQWTVIISKSVGVISDTTETMKTLSYDFSPLEAVTEAGYLEQEARVPWWRVTAETPVPLEFSGREAMLSMPIIIEAYNKSKNLDENPALADSSVPNHLYYLADKRLDNYTEHENGTENYWNQYDNYPVSNSDDNIDYGATLDTFKHNDYDDGYDYDENNYDVNNDEKIYDENDNDEENKHYTDFGEKNYDEEAVTQKYYNPKEDVDNHSDRDGNYEEKNAAYNDVAKSFVEKPEATTMTAAKTPEDKERKNITSENQKGNAANKCAPMLSLSFYIILVFHYLRI